MHGSWNWDPGGEVHRRSSADWARAGLELWSGASSYEVLVCSDRAPLTVVCADVDLHGSSPIEREVGGSPEGGSGELIAKAFRRWGADCFRWLVGEYAVAVWDDASRALYCARDPLGVRPLFYAYQAGARFVFGTEMERVIDLLGDPGPVD